MGSEVNFYNIKSKRSNLSSIVEGLRADARYEHGHGGYTGTIAEDDGGLDIIDIVMSEKKAEEHIYEKAQKWDSSIAIPLNEERTEWLVGGCYSC